MQDSRFLRVWIQANRPPPRENTFVELLEAFPRSRNEEIIALADPGFKWKR